MSRAEMSRLRIAATEAMNELNRKVSAAQGSKREALKVEYMKAVRLEAAASDKEIAAVLNENAPGATAKLTSAADALESEVKRLKQGAANLKQLGDAIKAGTSAVNLFNTANDL